MCYRIGDATVLKQQHKTRVDGDRLSERLIDWMTADRLAVSGPSAVVVMVVTESVRREVKPLFFLFLSVPFRFVFFAREYLTRRHRFPPPTPDVPRPSATAARTHVPPAFERRRWPSRWRPRRSRSDLVERCDTIIISQKYVFNVTTVRCIVSKALNFSKNIPFV